MDEVLAPLMLSSAPARHSDVRTSSKGSAERIYLQYGDYVFRALRRLGVDESSVEDAVQDVFMVILRKTRSFEGRSALRTWVFGIVLRVARAYRRRATRRTTDVGPDELPSPGADPAERTLHADEVRLLKTLLDGLSDVQREVFVLVEIEQMSVPEVAEVLGVKLNTAYSRLRLARRKFQLDYRRHCVRTGETR